VIDCWGSCLTPTYKIIGNEEFKAKVESECGMAVVENQWGGSRKVGLSI